MGIAVTSLVDALPLWRDVLGLASGEPEELAAEGVRVVFLPVAAGAAVELLEPTRDDSPVAKFLAKRGPGVHHLSFRVASCVEAIRAAEAAGIRIVPPAPRPGARGRLVAFFHPADTGGLLIEVCE
ncbi:MAG TPA: methylmalonyl-CoA epimerase [Gemmatimonadota bacterium]